MKDWVKTHLMFLRIVGISLALCLVRWLRFGEVLVWWSVLDEVMFEIWYHLHLVLNVVGGMTVKAWIQAAFPCIYALQGFYFCFGFCGQLGSFFESLMICTLIEKSMMGASDNSGELCAGFLLDPKDFWLFCRRWGSWYDCLAPYCAREICANWNWKFNSCFDLLCVFLCLKGYDLTTWWDIFPAKLTTW
jgi:hypothetical protein